MSDVFPFPADASRGRGDLVNVVAARKSLARELVDLVNASGLKLTGITIAELALNHLAARLDEHQRGAALVYMRGRYGQMVVAKDSVLYLSRRLDVSNDDLHDASQQENAVQSLALEMQRSLDYYESQLGQVPPSKIRFVTGNTSLPLKSRFLAKGLQIGRHQSSGLGAPAQTHIAILRIQSNSRQPKATGHLSGQSR